MKERNAYVDVQEKPTIHPDFTALVERYKTDDRYGSDEERLLIIRNLKLLGEFISGIHLPGYVKAVVLAGSYSAKYPNNPPEYGDKPVYGPFHKRQSGGSDIDLLFLHNKAFARGRTPMNLSIYKELEKIIETESIGGFKKVGELIHVSTEPLATGYWLLPEYARTMIRTGTLVAGDIQMKQYGTERENPPRNKKSDYDPIVDMMGL